MNLITTVHTHCAMKETAPTKKKYIKQNVTITKMSIPKQQPGFIYVIYESP